MSMTRNEIRAELIRRGIRLVDIARELKVAPSTVRVVVAGHRRSRRIERYIAQRIGLSYEEVWGNTEAA